jgi:hypothetical protein
LLFLYLFCACGPQDTTSLEVLKIDEALTVETKEELAEEEVMANVCTPDIVPSETMPHSGETPESFKFIESVMATRAADCRLLEQTSPVIQIYRIEHPSSPSTRPR